MKQILTLVFFLALPGTAFAVDNDGDGYSPAQGDCDDSDATVYPNAPELCDGKDNNCNGILDENCGSSSTGTGGTNPTATGGGGGTGSTYVTPPQGNTDQDGDGYTVNGGDCDDNDASVHPGANEVCDGQDNNCNGIVDEGCGGTTATTWPTGGVTGGSTGSSTGTSSSPTVPSTGGSTDTASQTPPWGDNDGDGYTPLDGDCDDNNATVYPGANEACNGIDDDCDGQVDEGCDTGTSTGTTGTTGGTTGTTTGGTTGATTGTTTGATTGGAGTTIDTGQLDTGDDEDEDPGCNGNKSGLLMFLPLSLLLGRRRKT